MAQDRGLAETQTAQQGAPAPARYPTAAQPEVEALVDDFLALAEWLRDRGAPSERR